jgi:hypothetical protein
MCGNLDARLQTTDQLFCLALRDDFDVFKDADELGLFDDLG